MIMNTLQSNIVQENLLKDIQLHVLKILKDSVVKSMGPAGSNTLILKGNSAETIVSEYTKDGHKIIKNIRFNNPIEMSIQAEIENITRHVEKTIGDGTTSAVVLASILYDKLLSLLRCDNNGNTKNEYSNNPYKLIRDFTECVENIKKEIFTLRKECTLSDIYNIAYTSTNGNKYIASSLYDIYNSYGMDVFIDVAASLDENSYIKDYSGLSFEVGYSDPAYINTQEGVCRLNNPKIYVFEDPIDTPEMVAYFEKIINVNYIENYSNPEKWIPTIIIAPSISRDMNGQLRKLISYLHRFDKDSYTQKPPILVISNVFGLNINHLDHISELCGCRKIRKYIDPEIQKKDQENGIAPTLDNIVDFCGTAELVESELNYTKFINPDCMYEKTEDGKIKINEDGTFVTSNTYNSLVNFLEAELQKTLESEANAGKAGLIKRQLNTLKSNMVEFFIGGVSIADRDSLRDLVEDAVLNCRSAAKHGVGKGANYNAYLACRNINGQNNKNNIYELILDSYKDLILCLYRTVLSDEEIFNIIENEMLNKNMGVYNINTKLYDDTVLTSIDADITILDTVSKIITIMLTSNQALVQAPQLNTYI